MIKNVFFIYLFCWARIVSAQENLIPNPSFEDYIGCPSNICITLNDTFKASKWYKLIQSPDYFNACGTGWGNINTAHGGGGAAQDGEGYIGLSVRGNEGFLNVREFVQSSSFPPLLKDYKYNWSFWVMLADSVRYASKNIGICFTKDSIAYNYYPSTAYFSFQPVVNYSGSNFLAAKDKWTEVSGSFIAGGEEKFIIIGNFTSDGEMEDIYLDNGSSDTLYWKKIIYYFIDNVSVVEDTNYHPIGIEEELIKRIQVNYSNGHLQTEGLLFQNNNTAIELYSLSGSKIVALPLKKGNEKQNVKIDGLANGVYLYALKLNNEVVKRGKILIRD